LDLLQAIGQQSLDEHSLQNVALLISEGWSMTAACFHLDLH
jgi:hypothetical protein